MGDDMLAVVLIILCISSYAVWAIAKTDSTTSGFVCIISLLVLVIIAFNGSHNWTNECLNMGHQERIVRNNNEYCITFGLEPEIVLLETESD